MALALLLLLPLLLPTTLADHYDVRCKCVCPNPSVVNATHTERKLYIKNVPPSHCNCPSVVIVEEGLSEADTDAFCPRCVCRYEQRNIFVIKVVVGMVICVISLLTLYMGFLQFIEPLITRRRQTCYRQHREEQERDPGDSSTDGTASNDEVAMSSRSKAAVLQRVGSQHSVEAAGAGPAEEDLRPAHHAQLGGQHGDLAHHA